MRGVIVVTNDDGYESEGLLVLVRALRRIGRVCVVAPQRPCSASAHSITIRRRPAVQSMGEKDGARWFVVDGTPADCILYAMPEVVEERVRIVVSGINLGANVGVNVHYSGTVAAAKQGLLQGIPSLAVSIDSREPQHLETAAQVALRWSRLLLAVDPPEPLCLCINVPDVAPHQLRGETLVRQDLSAVVGEFGTESGVENVGKAFPTDVEALSAQMVTVLPVTVDATSAWGLKRVQELEERFWSRG
ncbi:MAG: 5'/3'-nucleotidase SurE [Planctomycetota bacterium]|nr:MAG: 5'/3'-nucleotidase SurE [Planctomycetota bacterium]